ncbi:MAG: hypothetical protein ACYDGR_07665 [Candidatus Dormibacteria bacterium]
MRNSFVGSLAMVAVLGSLAACSGGDSTGKTDTFSVRVTGRTAAGGDLSASKGDIIKLTITTDRGEEVHLHGYDIHFDCKANMPLEKTFTADKTGQFEYELEASADHLGNLTVNP